MKMHPLIARQIGGVVVGGQTENVERTDGADARVLFLSAMILLMLMLLFYDRIVVDDRMIGESIVVFVDELVEAVS